MPGGGVITRNHWVRIIAIAALVMFHALPLAARENSTKLYAEAQRRALSGDIEGAITGFRAVVAISPYYALGHYGLGKALLHTENGTDLAIRHLRRAVLLDRRLAKGYFYLGMALMFQKNYRHALHAFNNAYRNNAEMIESLYNMYAIYDIMEARGKAQRYFDLYRTKKAKEERDVLF